MSGINAFNQNSKSNQARRPTSIQEILEQACPFADKKSMQVCGKIYKEILVANHDGILEVQVSARDFIKTLTLADRGLPLKQALVMNLAHKTRDDYYRKIISEFIEQAMSEASGNDMNPNEALKQAADVACNLGYPIHYLFDHEGLWAEIAVFDLMGFEDNVSLSVEVDFNGMMSVTAKQYQFKREQGLVMAPIKNFFKKFEHPHVTVNGDTCHTHYSHLPDIAKWAERQAFNHMVTQYPISILGALKRACPNAKEQDLRGCDMLYRAIQIAACKERLGFTAGVNTFIKALSPMNLALSLEQVLTQIFVVWNYNPQERVLMAKFIELALH